MTAVGQNYTPLTEGNWVKQTHKWQLKQVFHKTKNPNVRSLLFKTAPCSTIRFSWWQDGCAHPQSKENKRKGRTKGMCQHSPSISRGKPWLSWRPTLWPSVSSEFPAPDTPLRQYSWRECFHGAALNRHGRRSPDGVAHCQSRTQQSPTFHFTFTQWVICVRYWVRYWEWKDKNNNYYLFIVPLMWVKRCTRNFTHLKSCIIYLYWHNNI